MPTDQGIIDDILRREGGYVDHPADRGGPTNYGITLATLSSFEKRPCTVDELKAMDKTKARLIYKALYVDPFAFIDHARLRALLVDSGVNHGVATSIKWLQEALGVKADGVLGPQTERAYILCSKEIVYNAVLRRRIIFYGKIIKADHSQAVFAEGWMRRVCEFI